MLLLTPSAHSWGLVSILRLFAYHPQTLCDSKNPTRHTLAHNDMAWVTGKDPTADD